MKCRQCGLKLEIEFIDLGTMPPSNAYLASLDKSESEIEFPLKVLVCAECWLVQTEDFTQADELFSDEYAYFSSFSSSWLSHCEKHVESLIDRFSLTSDSMFLEVAANDGYLLKFVKAANIPCYGIEPTASTAKAAKDLGLDIVEKFFGIQLATSLAKHDKSADVIIANNVLAHVPDINDFIGGFPILMKSSGIATFEFPHLCELISQNQFDTIYHEHYSYLSLQSVNTAFNNNGLSIFDVERIDTHGGSLRVFAQRSDTGPHQLQPSVVELLTSEKKAGVSSIEYYQSFDKQAKLVRSNFISFLNKAQSESKKVAAYGAAAKGNTLLNFCGTDSTQISYVVDKNPNKQGMYLPGSHIPIVNESHLIDDKPDYIVIFPWNLATEISQQLSYASKWNAKFVTAVPQLKIIDA